MSRHAVVRMLPVVLALLFLAGPAFSEDKVLLRQTYKTGDKYQASVFQTMKITMAPDDGEPMIVRQGTMMEMGMEVLSTAEDGSAEVKFTYNRVAFKQKVGDREMDYDSADPGKRDVRDAASVGFRALAGKSLTMTFTPRGEVKNLRGLSEIIDAMIEEVPEGQQREAARNMLKQMLNEDTFAQQTSALGPKFPENAVGVGDAWKDEQRMNLGFIGVAVKSDYKVESMTADTVDLSVKSAIEIKGDGTAEMPMKITMEDGSRQEGTIKVNRVNPAVSSSEISQNLVMTVSAQGRTMRQTIKGNVTTSVKQVKD